MDATTSRAMDDATTSSTTTNQQDVIGAKPACRPRKRWTEEEDRLLLTAMKAYPNGNYSWKDVAAHIADRTTKDCRKRWVSGLNGSLRKGCWSAAEDEALKRSVIEFGHDWAKISTIVGHRSGDQCSKRWKEVLDPTIKRGAWTRDEDEQLLTLYYDLGTSWNKIAARLDGRRALSCRNRACKLLTVQKKPKPGTEEAEQLRLAMLAMRTRQQQQQQQVKEMTVSMTTPTPSVLIGKVQARKGDDESALEMGQTPQVGNLNQYLDSCVIEEEDNSIGSSLSLFDFTWSPPDMSMTFAMDSVLGDDVSRLDTPPPPSSSSQLLERESPLLEGSNNHAPTEVIKPALKTKRKREATFPSSSSRGSVSFKRGTQSDDDADTIMAHDHSTTTKLDLVEYSTEHGRGHAMPLAALRRVTLATMDSLSPSLREATSHTIATETSPLLRRTSETQLHDHHYQQQQQQTEPNLHFSDINGLDQADAVTRRRSCVPSLSSSRGSANVFESHTSSNEHSDSFVDNCDENYGSSRPRNISKRSSSTLSEAWSTVSTMTGLSSSDTSTSQFASPPCFTPAILPSALPLSQPHQPYQQYPQCEIVDPEENSGGNNNNSMAVTLALVAVSIARTAASLAKHVEATPGSDTSPEFSSARAALTSAAHASKLITDGETGTDALLSADIMRQLQEMQLLHGGNHLQRGSH